MDVSRMLATAAPETGEASETKSQAQHHHHHHHSTRHGVAAEGGPSNSKTQSSVHQRSLRPSSTAHATAPAYSGGSPVKKEQKHVVFVLVCPEDPRIQARLPMRVMISPSDTTSSIITTVKNFYGLYDYGVSFENKDGIGIIAAYNNFDNDMTVYVRTVAQAPLPIVDHARDSVSPMKPTLGAPFEMRPSGYGSAHSPSRSAAARSGGVRSVSPPASELGRRSTSVAPNGKARAQRPKSTSVHGDADGYSSGDNDQGSVTSSRRSKVEEIKAEITVDNIVEGGRRKRAFESSELPLFVPPQVPISASMSSISPQRRTAPQAGSPYAYPSQQQTFSYNQALPSPQSYGSGGNNPLPFGIPANPYQPHGAAAPRPLRGNRVSGASTSSNRLSTGAVLPTPDPTNGSVISDEDVALQLMRLGDPMAFSHGRTSLSTADDALSGKADAASSDDDASDVSGDEDEDDDDEHDTALAQYANTHNRNSSAPQRKKPRLARDNNSDSPSANDENAPPRPKSHKSKSHKRAPLPPHPSTHKSSKPKPLSLARPPAHKKSSHPSTSTSSTSSHHHPNQPLIPMSPASLPSQSRKASIGSAISFQHPLAADEDDLSSKPRCQRCRKSKKGCDRQRPCGRCRDAGIGRDGCISEDEGNGRKGRYGRHMGVPIKKGDELGASADTGTREPSPVLLAKGLLDVNGFATQQQQLAHVNGAVNGNGFVPGPQGQFLAPALPDKNKKRKR